jgi:hypothetical protein
MFYFQDAKKTESFNKTQVTLSRIQSSKAAAYIDDVLPISPFCIRNGKNIRIIVDVIDGFLQSHPSFDSVGFKKKLGFVSLT